MKIPVTVQNSDLFTYSLQHGINLFLGSGFSVLAKDHEHKALPVGSQLFEELCQEFKLKDVGSLSLPQLATIIEHSQKEQLRTFLKKRFSVVNFDGRYKILERLKINTIFTTNIDDLLYKVYAGSLSHFLNDLDIRGAAYHDRSAIELVTLHGSVLNDNRDFRFGAADLASAFSSDTDRWGALTERLQKVPTLFWGYSVGDAGTLQALSPSATNGRSQAEKWIVMRPDSIGGGMSSFFEALGFQIISASTEDMLDYLAQVLPSMPSSENEQATEAHPRFSARKLFPEDTIPEIGTVPVRSAEEFYRGAPPQWSDIFSGSIHRTSYFNTVRDSIYSRRHSVIIGIPACGKTTLLMQIAAEVDLQNHHKLICDSISLEKARLLLRSLGSERALIFLDNFSDSLEAFEELVTHGNVRMVVADRDYNFGIVSHRIDSQACRITDVSQLSGADFQACLQHIPAAIRARGGNRHRPGWTEEDDDDGSSTLRDVQRSLFETIEGNVAGPTLRDRFASVLRELDQQDPRLRDLLVMMSYVHQCRVPTSMDILYAYLHEYKLDHKEIYKMVEQLGSLVASYTGNPSSQEQDFFVARSALVGETVVGSATRNMLREMLLRFQEHVSPYRIPRYDTFKRYAYGSRLMVRAFSDVVEGNRYYEQAYARDRSPYLLQQCALYLKDMERYTEAFEKIDLAKLQSGSLIWSIRNAHAIIQFAANSRYAHEPGARPTLDESMATLTECYKWDKRKPFHAVTFADQAMKYYGFYPDEKAEEYLRRGLTWLQDEAVRSSWHRQVKYLLPKIRREVERLG